MYMIHTQSNSLKRTLGEMSSILERGREGGRERRREREREREREKESEREKKREGSLSKGH